MRTRRLAAVALLGLAISVLQPIVFRPDAAEAHGPYTLISTDDGTSDYAPTINGTPMQVRVLKPQTTAPASGWPLVIYMAGDAENRCANINEVLGIQTSWYTRQDMAKDGFAVLSFNARGMPVSYNAGLNPSGTSGCTTNGDAVDALDDSGYDVGGVNDKDDISDLIEWAVANYNPSGCAAVGSPCIDPNNVALMGYGQDATKTFLMAVPASANPQFNTRVKAVIPVGFGQAIRNEKGISSDGAGTPNFRPVDQRFDQFHLEGHVGNNGHADGSVLPAWAELVRDSYNNGSVSGTTNTWFDDRAIVDDDTVTTDGDPRVDKAGLIAVPTMVVSGFLDATQGVISAYRAFNAMTANTNRYLYLGPCGTTYTGTQVPTGTGPCSGTNATNLRTKVHAFLDAHLKGGPAITEKVTYVTPAGSPFSSTNWGTPETNNTAQWPPASGVLTSTYCFGDGGGWYVSPCVIPTSDDDDVSIANNVSATNGPGYAMCGGLIYEGTEVKSYTVPVGTSAVRALAFEMNMWIKSSTTRSQIYVDVFEVEVGGAETRVWQGSAQVVPTSRNGAVNTPMHFKFIPSGGAWQFKANTSIRVKVATNYRKAFAQELLPATYTLLHDPTHQMKISITWDL